MEAELNGLDESVLAGMVEAPAGRVVDTTMEAITAEVGDTQ